jgi:hypothetical protein
MVSLHRRAPEERTRRVPPMAVTEMIEMQSRYV